MFNIVLFEPEIPPNTGNIMRLCANTGARLHLIKPLGFSLEDKQLKRAGLDYLMDMPLQLYDCFEEYEAQHPGSLLYLCTTKAQTVYTDIHFKPNDTLVFGPETRGLPEWLLNQTPASQKLRVPMQAAARSLNLSNTVAIVLYEAWRQQDFKGSS